MSRAGGTVTNLGSGIRVRPIVTGTLLTMMLLGVGCSMIDADKPRKDLPPTVPDVPSGQELVAARTAFETGNFGFSARYFEQALRAAPDDMEACLGLAASYDWLYRFDLADPVYGTCRKIDEDNFLYFNNVGFSHLLRGELGKASVNFSQAGALRPGHPVVETNMKILRDASDG